ncbi:MAG: type II secretion system protein [Synergistaceae bacterium]|nr:type II secretion system protein [Synergistaceae bacterium]
MKQSRKGFTLVELLIVIVVIGVLSTMMMLSSTEAVSSAKASTIISNLRNWKTAALSWYVDNLNTAETAELGKDSATSKDIGKYLSAASAGGYNVTGKGTGGWYVLYEGSDLNNGNVKAKLAKRAREVGILGTAVSNDYFEATDSKVYMFVR